MAYNVSDDYKKVIYSGSATHRLKLLFNGVEYENANIRTESLKVTSNILSNGNNRFSLDNFVSKTAELVMHDIDLDDIIAPVSISIGTLVNNAYEYVPIGIFNLNETPTTDKKKVTIKLIDNSIKFDFPYDGSEVIENNNGEATMLQILQDICSKANVTLETTDFINKNTKVSVWDNSINARVYVMYIAEKAGRIATIARDGKLKLAELKETTGGLYPSPTLYPSKNLYPNMGATTTKLPYKLIESYTEGELLKISRVIYEDAIRKFDYGDDTSGTLYINSANPYITDTSEIENIYNSIKDFSIYSMKISKIIGNPAIDSWDIIRFNYNGKTYKILGQNILTYNGVITQSFDTQVGTNEKTKENVTLNSGDSKFRRLSTKIDQEAGNIELLTEQTTSIQDNLNNNYYNIEQSNQLIQNAQTGLTNTFSEAGGNNIFRNTGLWFTQNDENNPYEFWLGNVVRIKEDKANNNNALLLQNSTLSQEQIVPNGNYTISFKYKKLIELANTSVKINDIEIELDSTSTREISQVIEVSSQHVNLQFISDTDGAAEIYDLMVNAGSVKLAYSQNQNETTTDTVNISKGITITSSDIDVTFKANADGIRTLDRNGNRKTEFTDTGMITTRATIEEEAEIVDLLHKRVGNHIWVNKL